MQIVIDTTDGNIDGIYVDFQGDIKVTVIDHDTLADDPTIVFEKEAFFINEEKLKKLIQEERDISNYTMFLCDKCGKRYSSLFLRNQHDPLHIGDKPGEPVYFKCSSCGGRVHIPFVDIPKISPR